MHTCIVQPVAAVVFRSGRVTVRELLLQCSSHLSICLALEAIAAHEIRAALEDIVKHIVSLSLRELCSRIRDGAKLVVTSIGSVGLCIGSHGVPDELDRAGSA